MKKASTFRLNPELQSALEEISEHLGTTKNRIVNEALADYLEKRGAQLRDDLDDTLRKLRAYRGRDPRFAAEIERFASAESAHAGEDTHEARVRTESGQSLSREIHNLIHA